MPKRLAKTYNEQMMEIVDKWHAAGGIYPVPSDEIAAFAIKNNLWEPQKRSRIKQCARDLSRAMREVYFTDPQGRNARALHAARYTAEDESGHKSQRMFWADMRDPETTRNHMENAFQLRRKQILGDCFQLKTDADSFNERRPELKPIQLVFDFTEDLIELEQPDEYNPGEFGEDDK